jgi:hypothetical protein
MMRHCHSVNVNSISSATFSTSDSWFFPDDQDKRDKLVLV